MDTAQIENIPSNYQAYRKEALIWAQRLSGRLWTDYNAHDPGVTLMEVLSFVLTELDYKLGFSMEDILHSSSSRSRPPFELEQNALYRSEDIYFTGPVTEKDFRALLIDRVHGLANAWLMIHNKSKGEYNIKAQLESNVDAKKVEKRVRKVFDTYKVMGWSLNKITVIKSEEVQIAGNIYFESEHTPEKLLATLWYNFNEKLINMRPLRKNLDQLLELEGTDLADVFDGPEAVNGYVSKDELSSFVPAVSMQAIKSAMQEVDGVAIVSDLAVIMDDKVYDEKLPVANYLPYISPSEKHPVRVFRDGKLAEVDVQEVDYQYKKIEQAARRSYRVGGERPSSFDFSPKARNRNIATFHRLLSEFPVLYQLGERAFQGGNDSENKQFRQFLLGFEQFLSNSMKQVAETSAFFSLDHHKHYYNQQPLKEGDLTLKKIPVTPISFLKKRNEVLNHLLSRFDVFVNLTLPDLYYGDHPASLARRIKCKELLLKEMPNLSAYKASLSKKHPNGLSYLEYELYLKLWIDEPPKKPLTRVMTKEGFKVVRLDDDEGKVLLRDSVINALFEDELLAYETRFLQKSDRPMESLLKAGVKRANYSVEKLRDSRGYGLFLRLGNTRLKNLIEKRSRKKRLLKSMEKWIKWFYKINRSCEGFYVIDHGNVQSEALKAPHTASFVFPSWTMRFQSASFQRNTEHLIQGSMPAHMRVNVLWLNYEEMLLFERKFPLLENPELTKEEAAGLTDLEALLKEKLEDSASKS